MDKYNMSGIKISGLGALFTDDVTDDEIQEVEISRLKAFRNHPYRVLDNKDMNELVESIREHGVLEAVICRKSGDGFEIISGHRRKRACELAGLKTVPVRILNVSDDEATVYMVDANLHRETVLFSEKAWAYRMKYEAIKHQGKKGDDKKNRSSLDFMAEEANESGTQIKRYIRLTYLQPNLLDMVDEGKIPFSVGTVLSYLDDKSQRDLLELLRENCKIPSGIQAEQIKNLCLQGKMNKEIMRAILIDSYSQKEERKEDPVSETKKEDLIWETKKEDSVPETKKEDSVPETKKEDLIPETKKEDSVPETKKEDLIPETKKEDPVPGMKKEDLIPETKKEDPVPGMKKEDLIPKTKKGDTVPGIKKEDPIPEAEKEDPDEKNYGVEDVKVLFDKYTKELEEYIKTECPEHMIQENKILVDALTLLLEEY